MPIVNFYITGGAADLLQMRLAVKDNYNGQLVRGSQEYQCQLPSIPIGWHDNYRQWRKQYNNWLQGIETLTPSSPPIEIETNVSVVQECQRIGDELIREFNQWINNAFQIQLGLTKIVPPSTYSENANDFSFILHTNTGDPELDLILQRLPFHAWDFLEDYPHAEIALSTASFALPQPATKQRPQVLVIIGKDPRIDFTDQKHAIGRNLADSQLADVRYWSCTQDKAAIPDLFTTLKDSSPQILIFIGHSQSTMNASSERLDSEAPIRLYINESEFIDPNDVKFRHILKGLKKKGLIFAAFISCDGLRIAQVLNGIGIPYLMVSREILPVHVAKDFLDEFLAKATEPGVPIHIALSYARQHLQYTLETITVGGCPNASTFPAIFQIPEQHSYILNPKPVNHFWWKFLWPFDLKSKAINFYPIRVLKFILLFIFSLVLAIVIWKYFHPPVSACDRTVKGISYISCGEKSLLGNENIDTSGKEGMKELGEENPNLEKAIDDLETSWKNSQKNPEVLIALSNAKVKLEQQRADEQHTTPPIVKTIVVMIPASASISSKSMPIGFLAAVGEAQRAWNNTRHDWLLQTIVGNDENEPNIANKNVVKQIIDRRSIIGTVGPYSSHVAKGILPTYTRNKMTLISGTSTSIDLGRGHPFFFRTVSANNIQIDRAIKSKITQDEDIKKNLPEMIRQVTNNGMEGITGKITFKGSDRVENLRGFSKPKFDRNGKLTGYESVN
jgi:hypothetical protein